MPLLIRRPNASQLWKGLCDLWDGLRESICWHIQDDVNTDFWYDNWLDSDSRLAFSCTTSVAPSPIVVCDMVDNFGYWDWPYFSSFLPQAMLDRVVATMPHAAVLGQDLPGWRWEQNHCFSSKSAYDAIGFDVSPVRDFNWRMV
ncbi:hypothetical protein GQ457_09G006100 [Hibiscus cannabinus]